MFDNLLDFMLFSLYSLLHYEVYLSYTQVICTSTQLMYKIDVYLAQFLNHVIIVCWKTAKINYTHIINGGSRWLLEL